MNGGPLLAADRQTQIVRLVEQHRTVRVSDLAVQFGVTEETVRRDLDQLQAQGHLSRVHGGATLPRSGTGYEATFSERESRNLEAKRFIAERAATLVRERDTLILDASTTALQLARVLPDLELTVLTNSVKIVQELAGRGRFSVIAIGGMVRAPSLSFVGPQAERTLRNYRVDKAFLSCKGVKPDGVYESNELEAALKRVMMDIAGQVVLLADAEKVGQSAFALIGELAEVDVLVTDGATPAAFLREVAERGVQVLAPSVL